MYEFRAKGEDQPRVDIDLPSVSNSSNNHNLRHRQHGVTGVSQRIYRRVTMRGGCHSSFRHNKLPPRQDARSDIYLIRLQRGDVFHVRGHARAGIVGGILQVRSPAASIKALIAQCMIHISESTRHGVAANYPLASALITDSWSPRALSRKSIRKEAGCWDTVK